MARTLSTAQEDILTSAQYEVHTRLEVEDSTGAFINIGSLGGGEWFESALWDLSLDQPVAQMTIALRRDQGPSTGESLAPLDEESTFNVDAASAYAPLLDAGREIKFYTAATTVGGPVPTSSEFDFVFQGDIDDVNWQLSPLTLVARSKFLSQMADRFVETTQVYGSDGGTALETVIQSILDDWTDLGITLFTPISPGFNITLYEQQKMSVLDAVTTLAQLIGWEVREIFDDGTNAWRLRLAEPNRTATSSDKDFTFDASQYFNVNQASISRDDVRNVVNVIFGPASSRANVEVSATSSIDRFGRRWIEDEEAFNSSIDTSSEANTLANAILDDLKDPAFRHEIEVPYFWPGEIGDYYEFLKNDIHYSTDQFLAVYGISHELRRDRHRTLIRVRGQPAGQYLSWQQFPGGGGLSTGLAVALFDNRIRSIVSTQSKQQHFQRDLILQAGTATKSLEIDYSYVSPSTDGSAPTLEGHYFINVTPGDPSTHTLQTAGTSNAGADRTFAIKYGATSVGPLKDSNFFVSVTPWSEDGGTSGVGINGTLQGILVDDLGISDDVGIRALSSSGAELSGHSIVSASSGLSIFASTDGTIKIDPSPA